MKQIIQSYRTGKLSLLSVPIPNPNQKMLLVRTHTSLLSTGTEKYMLEMGSKSLLGKAMARPDQVHQVIAKAKAEGPLEAWRQALYRLDNPVPLGYSSAGVVIEVGDGVDGFSKGDRVACTGSGYAGHSQVASVPPSLCVKIPEGVNFESAAFVALGAIALEAVRMARVSLGENVAVVGMGLIGQIAVQLLVASGCHVAGMDLATKKAQLAVQYGAEAVATEAASLTSAIHRLSSGQGADAALIFAATPSNRPLELAAEVCRERGRVVAAGLVGLEIPRKPFYDKELDFVVSRAWGPGLYDLDYVEKGVKYPLAYARWTAQRNMHEFLLQVARGSVKLDHLISHRFPFECALEAYRMILEGKEPYLGVLLNYKAEPDINRTIELKGKGDKGKGYLGHFVYKGKKPGVGIGLIGAGLFTNSTLLPAMKSLEGLRYRGVCSLKGLSSRHTSDKFSFDYCTTDYQQILNDPETDLVFVLTRHGSHAHFVSESLIAGKHVFVEKPLAISAGQLQEITAAYQQGVIPNSRLLMVGFNRRFSPFTVWLKNHFSNPGEPLAVHCTVNAGLVPPDHWVNDTEQGGGRVVGEICHFVDLIQHLTGSLPVRVYAETLGCGGHRPGDNLTITLKMSNGSIGSIIYVAGGDKRYPRERVEVIGGGAVGVIENFQAASFTCNGKVQQMRNWLSVDRGHRAEIKALLQAIRLGGPAPVSFEEYVHTTLTTFSIEESLKTCQPVTVDLSILYRNL